MAIGDVVSGAASLTQYSTYDIRPGVGEEWIIHNLCFTQATEVHFGNGVNWIFIGWFSHVGRVPWSVFHLTRDRYLRLKNNNVAVSYVSFDGVASK